MVPETLIHLSTPGIDLPTLEGCVHGVLHTHFVGRRHDSGSGAGQPSVWRSQTCTDSSCDSAGWPASTTPRCLHAEAEKQPWTTGPWDNPQHGGSFSTWTHKEQSESELFRVKEFILQTHPQENTAPTFVPVFWMVSLQDFRGRLKAGAVYAIYFLNT